MKRKTLNVPSVICEKQKPFSFILGNESEIETYLEGGIDCLQLPYDFQRPHEKTYQHECCSILLSSTLYSSIKTCAAKLQSDFLTLSLVAFQTLLSRYSNQESLFTPMSFQKAPRKKRLNFFPSFIFGSIFNPTMSLSSYLKTTHAVVLKGTQSSCSNKLLFKKLKEGKYKEHPFNQILFNYEEKKTKSIKQTHILPKLLPVKLREQRFPQELVFSIKDYKAYAQIEIIYQKDLFKDSTIKRMLKHWKQILVNIITEPTKLHSQIEILTLEERQQLLITWNKTEKFYPNDKTIQQLVEEQVAKTPNNIAIRFEDQQMTYQQLNAKTNQLAHFLRERGVKPDILVALACDRSLEMIVGILGILKAGGAYVPIDPSHPPDRIRFILEDTKALFILTQSNILVRLPKTASKVFLLDQDAKKIKDYPITNPPCITQPHHLAYVIYTSGSTGKPKGVLNIHKGAVNRLLWMKSYCKLTKDDRILQKTPYTFDVSVWEFFLGFLAGAQIVIARPEGHKDPYYLREVIYKQGVTLIHFVPSMLEAFLRINKRKNCLSLKRVISSGETLSVALKDKFFDQFPQVKLHNLYGPTEASIDVTCWDCSFNSSYKTVPIGKPIWNTSIYILDQNLKPTPIGVPGELYIGGEGLARGYLNQINLTGERFIKNLFQTEEEKAHGKNTRLYKTGDLCCWLEDGNIEYIGRTDFQIKIRGFRIELGEIESILLKHALVRKAVVIAREDTPGDQRLVAYIVFKGGKKKYWDEAEKLSSYLEEKLPNYMIPSAFIPLEDIPLLINGKIDREGLPAPEYQRKEKTYIAPRTEMEKVICEIWQDVLKIKKIGIEDNFFELGGDSILNIQIVSRAQKYGFLLKLGDIFQYPTIAKICPLIKQKKTSLTRRHTKGEIPLLPIQQWFFENQFLEPHHWNQYFLLKFNRTINSNFLEKALRYIILYHEGFQVNFQYQDSVTKQFYRKSLRPLQIECVNLKSFCDIDQELRRYVSSIQKEIHFEKGPLYKIAIINVEHKQEKFLLIVMHHLIVDGISWRILWEDIETAYNQIANCKQPKLLKRANTYKDWGLALQNYSNSEEVKKESLYWQSINPSLPLPRDYDNGINTWEKSKSIKIKLSCELTHKLLHQVPLAYNTQINDILLTALALAFYRWTKRKDHFLHLEGHGREDFMKESLDVSRTIGWFTTLFPVKLQLADDKGLTLGDHLKCIKESLRAIPHRGAGYGALRYMSKNKKVKETFKHLDTADISFNYLGQLDAALTGNSLFQLYSFTASLDDISLKNQRSYLIDINSFILQEKLQVEFTYSTEIHRHETIQSLADNYLTYLTDLIHYCGKANSRSYTPSDFPLASLSQDKLDTLLTDNIYDIYPQTPMQQGLLFHTLHDTTKGDYLNQTVLWIEGSLEEEFLKEAWKKTIETYDILKTSFFWRDLQKPLQIVHNQVKIPWESRNWQHLSKRDIEKHLKGFLAEDRKMGYDLTYPPLMRIYLLRLSSEEAIIVWSHHHIILDGWSIHNVVSTLFSFYENRLQEKPIEPSSIKPFKEYVIWTMAQNKLKARRYWKNLLKGFETPTFLGIEYKKIQENNNRNIKLERLSFSKEFYKKVKAFAQSKGLTLNSLLHGVWGILLSRYNGQTDIVFGSVSGRSASLSHIEKQVGLFINTLPVRIQINQSDRVVEYLKKIQKQMSYSREYEYMPLWEIQSLSSVMPGKPLFNCIVAFDNHATADFRFSISNQEHLKISKSYTIEQEHYNLNIIFAASQNFWIEAHYNSTVYQSSLILNLLNHYEHLLNEIVEHPEYLISQLEMLTFQEKKQLLITWNCSQKDYPKDKTIPQLFEEQVVKSPHNIAIVFEDQQMTYQELNATANQLAHYLREKGVKPDTLVAMACERSLEMIIGILGILKAGGAYVPIDPFYPTSRIQCILEDTKASFLLAQQVTLEHLPDTQAETFLLDKDREKLRSYPVTNPSQITDPHHLAYVIYTSGSTGKPKGTLIPHSNVHRLFTATQAWFQFCNKDIWTLFHSYAFDFSVWEMWGALFYGGRLVIVPYLVTRSPESFYQLLIDQKVTILNQTPSAFYQLIFHDKLALQKNKLHLREVILGGEVLNIQKLTSWFKKHGDKVPRVVNMYGITEITVHASYAPIYSKHLKFSYGSYIGCPLPDLKIYILDPFLRPMPIGAIGEMYIGGEGLAREYLNQPGLTAERFIANPFGSEEENTREKSSRLYKTGDLARWLENSNIEYIGRCDDQVKIRGFRIELGEIESALLQQTQVKEAIVIVREDTPNDKRLVAYIVLQSGKEEQCNKVAELQVNLKRILPNYMLPAAFVVLEELPLTVNGKIDRTKLITPNYHRDEKTYSAPKTATEKILCELWQSVLKIKRVSIYDNFFELGGNSLNLIHLFSKIQYSFPKPISIKELYSSPTVVEQAACLDHDSSNLLSHHVLLLHKGSNQTPLFLIHVASGLSLCYSSLTPYLEDLPLYAINHPFFIDNKASFVSIEDMASFYIKIMKTIQPKGPYRLGGWSFGGLVAHEMACQLSEKGEEIEIILLIDTYHPKAISILEKKLHPEDIKRELDNFLIKMGIQPSSSIGKTIKIIHNNNTALIHKYQPKTYRGRVALLKGLPYSADCNFPQNKWDQEQIPYLEISSLNAKHDDFFDPITIIEVGRWIRACLNKKRRGAMN